MTLHDIAEHLRTWPTPPDWPAIVQRLVNEETGEELQPSRRRAWLMWRLVCVQLSGRAIHPDADPWEIADAVTAGQLRVYEYSCRSAAGERQRPGDLRRRDISRAFTSAMFAVQRAERVEH
jgi:hypothetical protein